MTPTEAAKTYEEKLMEAMRVHKATITRTGPEGGRKYIASFEIELEDPSQPSHISGQGREVELEKCLGELVEGYESWEAELISDNRCWGPEGMNSYPTLTRELYDKMIELQGKRNKAKSLLNPDKTGRL